MDSFSPPTIARDIWSPSLLGNQEDAQRGLTALKKFNTGSKAIDEAFDGGLDFGAVHCITSKGEHGGQDLLLALLATHLLRGLDSAATVIDSTLSFDVRRLHRAISSVISGDEDAVAPLTRLKISKVFDYVGMAEAIAELGDALQNEVGVEVEGVLARHIPAQMPVFEDSDDEAEEELLDGSRPPPATIKGATDSAQASRLLIISNISHVMGPIIKNDFTQGQALLTSLMHSITDVTKRHNLCTIVFCEAAFKAVPEDETLSHFKSCRIKPAVGYGLGYLVDVHLYLHKLGGTKSAAADVEEGQRAQGRDRPLVSVLEIVEDRDGARRGGWACFDYTGHGMLTDLQ